METRVVLENVRELSIHFAAERHERQQRRELIAADFAQLREAGVPLAGVPVDHGGIWESVRRSTRPLCELLRTLAHGDSSVALVCAMHPTVLVFWLANAQVPAPFLAAWEASRAFLATQPGQSNGWEYYFALAAMALAVLIGGAGALPIDFLLRPYGE